MSNHTTFWRKNKDWLARNHDIVSEWSDTSIELYCLKQRTKRKDWLVRNRNNVPEWSDMSTN